MSKCIVCGKEIYGSKSPKCRECTLQELPISYCDSCGKELSPEQSFRGFRYCSHACHWNSSQAKEEGIIMNKRNRTDSPWWNYKNFIRYPDNKEPYAFLYVVYTDRGIKVGITSYFYKRIEEVTRTEKNRSTYFIYTVQVMPTLDASYLESYIHRMFPHENEYHRLEDCIEICRVINNPRSWTLLNHLRDDRNPDLQYPHKEVFRGTYKELENEFILKTGECNLSKWTVGEHRKELYLKYITVVYIDESWSKDPQHYFSEDRLFELHDGLITHNCRLRLDMRELSKRYGGLFGAGDSTGSIGVVTLNLPRFAYIAKSKYKSPSIIYKAIDEFYKILDEYMDLAKESLLIKREYLQHNILEAHMIPAFEEYVGTLDNHFNTIGLVGMNEMCLNLLGVDILSKEAHNFCLGLLEYMRNKLSDYQEETNQLFNLEATPAESTCVVGDTLVQTTEGNIPIKELVGREDVNVLCYDVKTNQMHIRKAYDIRKTGENKQVVRVTFDNGQSEIMTPNHHVLTREYHVKGRGKNRKTWYSYEWISAGCLVEGMSIVSNYQSADGCLGYGEDRVRNSLNGKLMHRFIYEELVGEIPEGHVLHHIDFNKNNNSLDNLQLMTSTQHKSLHASINNPRPEWRGEDNPFYNKHHTEKSKKAISSSKLTNIINNEDIISLNDTNTPYEEIATILGCSRDTIKRRMKELGIWDKHTPNHKVVSVEYLDEYYDVYNMEVEEFENYFIGGVNGLLVHNCYRLAKIDKEAYGDIITQGTDDAPYYTNSCHMPVKDVTTIQALFDHQNELQTRFTGGTVIHCYLEGPITAKQAKQLIHTVMYNYSAPYVSLSPLNAICPEHGLLMRSYDNCPICGKETDLFQRITGYVRNVRNFNPGKRSEFLDRKQIKI